MKKRAIEAPEADIEEPYSFSKDKIPKTLSYPLKRSLLDSALNSAGIYTSVWSVHYVGRRNSNVVLDAMFSPEQYSDYASGKTRIAVWAAPREQRKKIEQLIVTEGLPILCAWLCKTQTEANVWRGFGHTLTFTSDGLTLEHRES